MDKATLKNLISSSFEDPRHPTKLMNSLSVFPTPAGAIKNICPMILSRMDDSMELEDTTSSEDGLTLPTVALLKLTGVIKHRPAFGPYGNFHLCSNAHNVNPAVQEKSIAKSNLLLSIGNDGYSEDEWTKLQNAFSQIAKNVSEVMVDDDIKEVRAPKLSDTISFKSNLMVPSQKRSILLSCLGLDVTEGLQPDPLGYFAQAKGHIADINLVPAFSQIQDGTRSDFDRTAFKEGDVVSVVFSACSYLKPRVGPSPPSIGYFWWIQSVTKLGSVASLPTPSATPAKPNGKRAADDEPALKINTKRLALNDRF